MLFKNFHSTLLRMLELKATMRYIDRPELKIQQRYWELPLYRHSENYPMGVAGTDNGV
jgi:hypothetical protein